MSASRRICLRGGLPTAGSAYSGVCLQVSLPPRGSASLRSASRSLCLLRGSTSRGSTSSGVCLPGGSASQAVCLQGGFTDPQTRKAGSTHPTGMIFFMIMCSFIATEINLQAFSFRDSSTSLSHKSIWSRPARSTIVGKISTSSTGASTLRPPSSSGSLMIRGTWLKTVKYAILKWKCRQN